jgi:hypothetical protein
LDARQVGALVLGLEHFPARFSELLAYEDHFPKSPQVSYIAVSFGKLAVFGSRRMDHTAR